MSKTGIKTAIFGFAVNFALFLLKLYIGISTSFLSIYCDSINNLGDTVSCVIALIGFILAIRLNERKSRRAESLATFVISSILFVTGGYFIYSGVERLLYPVMTSYSRLYAILLMVTVAVKMVMAVIYYMIHKKNASPVFKALITDSILDCVITAAILFGFTLSVKINFAVDALLTMLTGTLVAISSAKAIIEQTKFLIND